MIIREACTDDKHAILELTQQLALCEKKNPEDFKLTIDKIERYGFGDKRYFHSLIAEQNQKPVGYAIYFYTFSSYAGAPNLYLEDLFILPEYRKCGIGKAFMHELAKQAMAHECYRMEWHAYKWNQSAIDFYQSLGAEMKNDLVMLWLEEQALANLAT